MIIIGKNRMEALGDVAETEDLIRWAADMMEQNNRYHKPLGSDPLEGLRLNWQNGGGCYSLPLYMHEQVKNKGKQA